jgi:hypothetical protein
MTAMNPEQGRRVHGKLSRPRARMEALNQRAKNRGRGRLGGSWKAATTQLRLRIANHEPRLKTPGRGHGPTIYLGFGAWSLGFRSRFMESHSIQGMRIGTMNRTPGRATFIGARPPRNVGVPPSRAERETGVRIGLRRASVVDGRCEGGTPTLPVRDGSWKAAPSDTDARCHPERQG